MSDDKDWLVQQDEKSIEAIAKVSYAAHVAYSHVLEEENVIEWDTLPPWKRDAIKAGVRLRLRNPNAPISSAHDYWCDFMTKEGWTFGDVRDDDKKTHPDLIDYHALPPVQKMKDYLFVSVVLTMAADIGMAEREQVWAAA